MTGPSKGPVDHNVGSDTSGDLGSSSDLQDTSAQSIKSKESDHKVPSNFVPYLTHQPSLDQFSVARGRLSSSTSDRQTNEWNLLSVYEQSKKDLGHTESARPAGATAPEYSSLQEYSISEAAHSYQEEFFTSVFDEEIKDTPKRPKGTKRAMSASPGRLRRKKSRTQLGIGSNDESQHEKLSEIHESDDSYSEYASSDAEEDTKHRLRTRIPPRSLLPLLAPTFGSPKKYIASKDTCGLSIDPQLNGKVRYVQPDMSMPYPAVNVDSQRRLIRTSDLGKGEHKGRIGSSTRPERLQPVKLTINSDLKDVPNQVWSKEEVEQSRRLVEFKVTQTGAHVVLEHAVISQEYYFANLDKTGVVVSCIWDQRQQECYITSTDVLTIIEAMVGVSMSMFEKNRLRRNLEYSKPHTVSKEGSPELFKLIMSYGPPRPRKIIKDTKVLLWGSLEAALRRLLSKYSVV